MTTEKIRKKKAEYYLKNRIRIKEKVRRYYFNNKDKCLKFDADYRRKFIKTSLTYLRSMPCLLCNRNIRVFERNDVNLKTGNKYTMVIGNHNKKPYHYINLKK